MILKEFGKDARRGDGYRIVEHFNELTQTWTLGIDNSSPNQMKVKFSMEESENLELSGKSRDLNKLVAPNSLEFLMHA